MEALEIEVYKSTGIVFCIVLGKIYIYLLIDCFGQFRKGAYHCNRRRGEYHRQRLKLSPLPFFIAII